MPPRRAFLLSGLLVVASIAISLAVAEVVVRAVAPQNLSGAWRVPSERGYMLNKAGGKARHQHDDRVVFYRFNEFHLRGGSIVPEGTRVLVLGDSFTFGWLLNEEDTYVHRLQVFSDVAFGQGHLQFLNGGAGGWGTADYLAYVEEFGEKLKAKVVIVFLNADDIGRSLLHGIYHFDPQTGQLSATAGAGASTLKKVANGLFFYDWLLEHSHLLQLTRKIVIGWVYRLPHATAPAPAQPAVAVPETAEVSFDPSYARAYGRALFQRLSNWCRTHDVKLLVLTTGWHGLRDPSGVGISEPTAAFLERAKNIFREEGIPYHDLAPEIVTEMKDKPESFVIPNDGHPNERGSLLIATASWDWLMPQLKRALEDHVHLKAERFAAGTR